MVESNIISLIIIWSFVMIIVIIVGIIVLLWNKMINEHEKENEDKNRALELEKAKLEYTIKLKELEANKIITTKKEEDKKDMPGSASEEETKAWFDLLADPFKLTEDKKEV